MMNQNDIRDLEIRLIGLDRGDVAKTLCNDCRAVVEDREYVGIRTETKSVEALVQHAQAKSQQFPAYG